MSVLDGTRGTVICNGTDNGQSCPEQGDSDSLGLRDAVASTVRRHLKARGWAVSVPNPEPGNSVRLDLCPAHKPEPREG